MSEADRDLVPDQFPALNKQFYERCPADYFGHRLRLLLTFWGRPDDVLDLFEEGVTVGELSAGGHVDLKDDSVERFVAADLEVLWHHTAESMLRAYLAHRDLPACPWLEVARLRQHARFKRRVESEILTAEADDLLAGLGKVLTGTDDAGTRTRAYGHSLRSELEATALTMRRVAERYLDHSNAYNSAKHGLAVFAGDHGLSIGDTESPIIDEQGPALSYLEERTGPDGHRRWHRTITWLHLDQMVGSIVWLNRLLESTWTIARARYLEEEPAKIHLPTREIVEAIEMHAKKAITVPHLPLPLQYWAAAEDA